MEDFQSNDITKIFVQCECGQTFAGPQKSHFRKLTKHLDSEKCGCDGSKTKITAVWKAVVKDKNIMLPVTKADLNWNYANRHIKQLNQ